MLQHMKLKPERVSVGFYLIITKKKCEDVWLSVHMEAFCSVGPKIVIYSNESSYVGVVSDEVRFPWHGFLFESPKAKQ